MKLSETWKQKKSFKSNYMSSKINEFYDWNLTKMYFCYSTEECYFFKQLDCQCRFCYFKCCCFKTFSLEIRFPIPLDMCLQ